MIHKIKMKKYILSFVLVLLMGTHVFAGSIERLGTSGAQELLIPMGSVGTALGGSFNAGVKGVEAAYWNPAGVSKINGTGEFAFSQLNYIADINVMYAAAVAKLGRLGVVGATLKTIDFGDIPVTTTEYTDGTGETYSPRYFTLGLIYSKALSDRISFGTKLNVISEQIMRTSATGLAVNVGVQYEMKRLSIGIAIRNFGLDMLFTGPNLEQNITPPRTEPGTRIEPWRVPLASFELPTIMEMGVVSKIINSELMSLSLGGAFLNDNFGYDQINLGVEMSIFNMVYLRGSYSMGVHPDTGDLISNTEDYLFGPAFGGGININLGNSIVMLDYSSRVTTYFANNQWLTMRIAF